MIAMDMPVSGIYDDYLMHHGIKGMKWGVRRYQNEDGSLTEAGKRRYGTVERFNDEYVKPREERKAAHAAKRTERLEKRKNRAIDKGNIDKILKYAPAMSSQELQDAVNRARNIKALTDLKGKKKSLLEKVANATTKISNATNGVANAVEGVKRMKKALAKDKTPEEEAYKKSLENAFNTYANEIRSGSGSIQEKEKLVKEAATQLFAPGSVEASRSKSIKTGKDAWEKVYEKARAAEAVQVAKEARANTKGGIYEKEQAAQKAVRQMFEKPVSEIPKGPSGPSDRELRALVTKKASRMPLSELPKVRSSKFSTAGQAKNKNFEDEERLLEELRKKRKDSGPNFAD